MRLRGSQSSGVIPGTISALGLALRTVMQRLEASDTRGGSNIQLRARWRISPPDFAIRLRMDKFWSTLMCSAPSKQWRTLKLRANSPLKALADLRKHSTCVTCAAHNRSADADAITGGARSAREISEAVA